MEESSCLYNQFSIGLVCGCCVCHHERRKVKDKNHWLVCSNCLLFMGMELMDSHPGFNTHAKRNGTKRLFQVM